MVKVKICGITDVKDALLCSAAGAHALGFIFTEKSPRCLKEKQAAKIIASLGPFITKVGVFLDQDKDEVLRLASSLGLDALQFHGAEDADYCRFFQGRFKVIKTIFPGKKLLSQSAFFPADAFLVDVKYEDKVRGEKYLPPAVLKEIPAVIKTGKRVIVSGGLDPDNVAEIVRRRPYAVDVASGVEAGVGRKDKRLVAKFIERTKDL